MSVRGPYFKVFLPSPDVNDTPYFEDGVLEFEYLMQCMYFVLNDPEVKFVLLYNILCLVAFLKPAPGI